MPVTVRPAAHEANACSRSDFAKSAEDLLFHSCKAEWQQCKKVLQSGFERTRGVNDDVLPSSNGFVRAAYMAYNEHCHLTIRPEDVWFAILTQLSTYINANAEALRSHFVAHDGKQDITAMIVGKSIDDIDFSQWPVLMTEMMESHIVDPDLRKWMMPEFTTTTWNDIVVAAIIMMGSMQEYFAAGGSFSCGIPSVTLQGEQEDWINIRQRLDRKLPQLGRQPEQFAILLRPILDYFVRSFKEPENEEVIGFWSKIMHKDEGSGSTLISGWITAFCFWNNKGERLYDGPGCDIGGVKYHSVDADHIPQAYVSVPAEIDGVGGKRKIKMTAGLVGIGTSYIDAEFKRRSTCDSFNAVRPVSGWWAYELVSGKRVSGVNR